MAIARSTYAAIRYGYGLAPGEAPPADADALLAQLPVAKDELPAYMPEGFEARRTDGAALQHRWDIANKAVREGTLDKSVKQGISKERNARLGADVMGRVLQAVRSPYGFHERLVAFWFDHFSVSTAKSVPSRFLTPLFEAEAIRPHVSGRFVDLLLAAEQHPAMLIFLDQDKSAGPDSAAARKGRRGLNENLGRELIELHTMGARSGYTQADVRSAAMVLAGLTVDREGDYSTVFKPAFAQPGETTVVGARYGGGKPSEETSRAMMRDLAAHPQTAQHICRKLVTHFIADTPPDEVVKPMVEAWQKSDGDLTEVYRAMLAQPRAWDGFGMKIKRPFDFIVSGLRAVNAGPVLDEAVHVAVAQPDLPSVKSLRFMTEGAMNRMGQPLWKPPSPAGFDEHSAAWLTPSQLAERITWAHRAVGYAHVGDPAGFARSVLGDFARDDTLDVISRAPNRAQAAMLVLASAEFNRR